MEPTDETLLAQYKQGDPRAFRALVERYTAPLYNFAFRLLGDAMEAENITQETFLRVVGALDRIRTDLPFKPYLFRIALNLCRDAGRKKRAVSFDDWRADSPHADEVMLDDAPALWEQMADEELRAELHAAMERLPARYRAALTLRYVEGFSYAEIAQILNLPLNTVRTHLRRAKQQLRTMLRTAPPAPRGPNDE